MVSQILKWILIWISALIIVYICYVRFSPAQREGFSLGKHEGEPFHMCDKVDFADRIEFTAWFKDGCILWFYIIKETGLPDGHRWLVEVSHGVMM